MQKQNLFYNSLVRQTCLTLTILALFIAAGRCKTGLAVGAQNSVSQASQTKFRLIRSISGSKGHEEGQRYVIDDPRTVFRIPDDRQVLVYLEWEGAAGLHEFEGHWKNPAGKVVVISDFKLEVRQKNCAGFFTMLLSETTEQGIWTLEARVDGEITGQHKFQIVSAKDPAEVTEAGPPQAAPTGPPPEQARQPLTESEIYELANSTTFLVEKLDPRGVRIDSGSGFFVDTDMMLTAFQVIDGATKLRVSFADGRRIEIQEALSWDRWQDWAFLKVDAGQKRFIKLAANIEAPVGSRVFALAVSPDSARVIVRCDIVGKNRFPQNGERLNLNCTHPDVVGSPLLNEYGDMIGVVGGSLIPGWSSTKMLPGVYHGGAQIANTTPGLVAVPITSKPSGTKPSTNFQQLASEGAFTPILTRFENIQYGTLAKRVETKPVLRPMEETLEFRSNEGSLTVFVSWRPKEKIKTTALIRIYDLSSRLLIESKPTKIDLKPGKEAPSYTWWRADISSLKPAFYRVDVLVDSSPMWRAFFKIRD